MIAAVTSTGPVSLAIGVVLGAAGCLLVSVLHTRTRRGERDPWTADAERCSDEGRLMQHPVWGLLGEDDSGDLVLPAWRNLAPEYKALVDAGEQLWWWNRRLNLRNPAHWPAFLRSRLTRKLVWLDAC